jgi:glyoxylase-like metal-dependent hydrolase (beta-lactamase superfamily II)
MKHYLVILCFFPLFLKAQPPLDFIRKAITVNGQWEKIDAFQYQVNRYNFNPWQSYAFNQPKAQKDNYQLSFDKINNRYTDHIINHYPGGYIFNFVSVGIDSTYYEYDVLQVRTGKLILKLGSTGYEENLKNLLSYFPYYILKEVIESGDQLRLEKTDKEIIIYRSLKNGAQKLWFDAKTRVLNKYNKTQDGSSVTWKFSNYSSFKGYLVPKKVKQVLNNTQTITDDLISFKVSKTIDSKLFILPNGYRYEEIRTEPLKAKEIGKDVFLVEKIDGDRNIIFINMNDYIVLSEAPISDKVSAATIALIHKTLPGKPIKYVHLSHFHKDHIGGIRKLAEAGVTIICTRSMEKPIRKLLGRTEASFAFFDKHQTLSDPDHKIDIFEVPNSHVNSLSFLYLPLESIIYEGDLLSVPGDGSITPAIQVYKEFFDFIKENKLMYKRIIGHHGLSDITPELVKKIYLMPALTIVPDGF